MPSNPEEAHERFTIELVRHPEDGRGAIIVRRPGGQCVQTPWLLLGEDLKACRAVARALRAEFPNVPQTLVGFNLEPREEPQR